MNKGINFSPWTKGIWPGSFLTGEDIHAKLEICKNLGFGSVRTYGSGGALSHVPPASKYLGLKVSMGAWLCGDLQQNESEIATLIELCNKFEGTITVAIVGNEVLHRKDLTEDQMLEYIRRVKSQIPSSILVTSAETNMALKLHPSIISACDVVYTQIYPFWGGAPIESAVEIVDRQFKEVQEIAQGKNVVLAETGWPSDGEGIGAATCSRNNAARFFNGIVEWGKDKEYFYFAAFDEAWKVGAEGQRGAHWGIMDEDGKLKGGFQLQ
eukprot:TRINITY_DN2522_c0_g1_i1.p1 TRINITY_DN2522_c0_g1~~TRINITY_DN2522_c0_g1_i1.p1  ORF type:complete len:268 (+),score=60.61 TRINITY_DN2522_c0_g1_i1:58-861(+)